MISNVLGLLGLLCIVVAVAVLTTPWVGVLVLGAGLLVASYATHDGAR